MKFDIRQYVDANKQRYCIYICAYVCIYIRTPLYTKQNLDIKRMFKYRTGTIGVSIAIFGGQCSCFISITTTQLVSLRLELPMLKILKVNWDQNPVFKGRNKNMKLCSSFQKSLISNISNNGETWACHNKPPVHCKHYVSTVCQLKI